MTKTVIFRDTREESMNCPHCAKGIYLKVIRCAVSPYNPKNFSGELEETGPGYGLSFGICPSCYKLIAFFEEGTALSENLILKEFTLTEVSKTEVIYPKFATSPPIDPKVPLKYRKVFEEAVAVLIPSPKASAAISRRLLQQILREEFKLGPASLAKEIEGFLQLDNVPSYIGNAVDAIRNVGNFAAHPLKDTNTGQIIDVEPGEAEWLLEVLDLLFDFTFVQPQRLEARKERLNKKLKSIGKPPMKSTK